VGHSIQPGVLDQNIKAVEERPSGRTAAGIGLVGVNDNSLLFSTGVVATKTKRESDLMHDYEGNGSEREVGADGCTEGQVLSDAARYTNGAGA
jgi:hypothetical protein